MKPNIVIVKIKEDLHMFPLTGEGTIMNPSIQFDSNYVMEESQLIFASFNTNDNTSTEIARFTISLDEVPVDAQLVIENGDLIQIVHHLYSELE